MDGGQVLRAVMDRLPTIRCRSVLHIGPVDTALNSGFATSSSHVVVVHPSEACTLQLEQRFEMVVIGVGLLADADAGQQRAIMHSALQHIGRSGHLVILHDCTQPALADSFWADDLQLIESSPFEHGWLSLYRRGDRLTVHDLLFEARAVIRRVTPAQLHHGLQSVDPPLVLDTRTHTDRGRFGVIPGAVHVPRTVLEWHFDPANGYLHPAMRSFDQPLVLVCNGGYSSSLAAANLVKIGFTDVADLIGGHTAWAAAGLPVGRADHSHLDTPGFDDGEVSAER